MAKMTEHEIRAVVAKRFSDVLGGSNTELAADREKALDFYYGRPLGNEIDGRSQIVSKDVMDTVEWLMPSLMRIFTTKQAAQFDPVGPEDEQLAKQETEYVSHVLWKKNDGFMIIYTWLKDALMQKVGYVKYMWVDEEKVCFEQYTGLSQDQLAMLQQELEQDGEAEIIEADIKPTAPGVNQAFDVKYRIKKKQGRLVIENCPQEEVFISSDCKGGVKTAKFVGHLRRATRSELLELGFDRKTVEQVTDWSWKDVELSRGSVGEDDVKDEGIDWATEELQLLDCHTYVDADDDGIAELRHFLMGGDTVLVNEEADEIPWCSWSMIPTPHRHVGLGVYDLVEDLQRTNSGLQRSLLDNAYFGNNQRLAYDENMVDVDMLRINRPGGHVAVSGSPVGAVVPLPVSDIASRLLPVIGYVEQVRARRTGVGDMSTGVDADVLAQSTKGAYMDARGAANQRIEAIARIFAQTGLSDLYSSIHRMLMKHQDWPARFKIKNNWVEVNPAEWKERANLTVSVGLGTAGKEEIRANLGMISQLMQQAAQVPGLIQPRNVYAVFSRMQEELGFEGEDFITDPASPEYQQFIEAQSQQAPDPYLEGEKIKAEARANEKMLDVAMKGAELAQERDLEITKLEVTTGVDLAKAGIGAEVAAARGYGQARAGSGAAAAEPAAYRGVGRNPAGPV